MSNTPATPIEKYVGLREHYVVAGKEFDSEAMKPIVINGFIREKGMKEDSPQFDLVRRMPVERIAASEERERSIRRADAEGRRELDQLREQTKAVLLEAQGEMAGAGIADTRMAALERENAEMKALLVRMAEKMGVDSPVAPAGAPEPGERQLTGNYPPGRMTSAWKLDQMLAFAEDHEIIVPEELKSKWAGKMKTADYIMERFDEREAVAS